ncbi:MAG: hypothetical protein IJI35_02270, partial [Kiritimatiellae bacterium]|nr:hypothetical protein [Kiritimatiellia bacterium]
MDNIIFSLTKVSDAITDKTLYRANVQTNGTLGRDELAERLAERTKQDVSLWKYFLDALSDEIGIQLLAGYRINLGQLTTGFAIRGAFMSEDEAFDPARHQLVATIRTLDPLRGAMSAVLPENVTLGLTCTVAAVMDAVTKHLSEITGTEPGWFVEVVLLRPAPGADPVMLNFETRSATEVVLTPGIGAELEAGDYPNAELTFGIAHESAEG